jgi:hypothetical protein
LALPLPGLFLWIGMLAYKKMQRIIGGAILQGKTLTRKMGIKQEMLNTKALVMAGASVLAVTGAYLNAMGNILCFPVWLFTNMVFLIHALREHSQWMDFLFFLYFCTSLLGLWRWS